MPSMPTVRQLRLVVTATDYDQAVHFYRDVLGLIEAESFSSEGGRVTILDAGQATLEIADPAHAEHVDQVEVGRRVAGHIRVAFEVDDAADMTERSADAGATVIAQPVTTPWNSLNSRLQGPAGLQLTLFTELGYEIQCDLAWQVHRLRLKLPRTDRALTIASRDSPLTSAWPTSACPS